MRSKLKKKWLILPKQSDNLVEQLLLNRKIDPQHEDNFLNPDYERDLIDPFKMKNMEAAVKRVIKAVRKREPVAIYGDYDCDGTPGAALLYTFFKKLGHPVMQYIPTRDEGYGLNHEAVSRLSRDGAKLLITVDTGVRNTAEIELAQRLGMGTIVCDHHLPPHKLPAAIILNPKQPGDNYPFKELAGTGVAFKLLQALTARANELGQGSREEWEKFLKWQMDLVGIATICDLVPLVGENRVLARYGLLTLAKTKRPGLGFLYETAAIDPTSINAYSVSFLVGPRLNAAGRMDHATQAFYLLTTDDHSQAKSLADELNRLNRKRQELLDKVLKEARAQVTKEKLYEKKVILVGGEKWPHGIIGLVAGKLVEEFARPVIVFERGKIRSKGSARSIDAFHIVEALDHCQDVLLKHGGHAKAAGLTLETAHLSTLYDKLLEIAESKLTAEDLIPTLSADTELKLEEIDDKLLDTIKQFEPHGLGNPRPIFVSRDALVQNIRAVGADGKHLKLTVSGKDAIAFDFGELVHEIVPGDVVDIIYSVERNEWNGRSRLELKVLDLKKSGFED